MSADIDLERLYEILANMSPFWSRSVEFWLGLNRSRMIVLLPFYSVLSTIWGVIGQFSNTHTGRAGARMHDAYAITAMGHKQQ